jgi:RNA polymerase sigma factor (sigma-70 family)
MARRSWWNGNPGWPSRVRKSLNRPSTRTPPSWPSCAERTRRRPRPSWTPTAIASIAWPVASRATPRTPRRWCKTRSGRSSARSTLSAESRPSWLYRIAANAAYQKVRGRRRRPEVPLDDVLPSARDDGHHAASIADWSPTVDDPSRQADLRLALTAALNALPADYRAAVVLRDIEEFSIAEVAELLGLSVANVKSRVHRARLFLRQRLTVSLATSRESAQERTAPTRSWRRRLAESPPVRGGRNAWSPSRRRTPKGAATACPCASRHPVPRREPAYRKSWLKEASMTR